MTAANGIIILSPPHSYASEFACMLGRHPQLYSLPDINLFAADTVEGWYTCLAQQLRRPQSTHGLLRVLAQLHEEQQTEQSINRAWDWLAERKTWTTQSLWNYIARLVHPRVLVDKSVMTTRSEANLQRALRSLPGAQFIHLTRHPVTTSQSLDELRERMQRYIASAEADEPSPRDNSLLFWYKVHSSILLFVEQLPEGQALRVCSEDILQAPERYLPQVLDWLGLKASPTALDAMQHPEFSPFACLGPINAQYGDDRDFLTSPTQRPSFPDPDALESYPGYADFPEASLGDLRLMALQLGYA